MSILAADQHSVGGLPARRASSGRALRIRTAVALGAVGVVLLLLVVQLVRLQIAEASYYRRLAQQQQILTRELAAPRGNIYDREGRLLASSVRAWSVFADPQSVESPQRTAALLSAVLKVPAQKLLLDLAKDCCFIWVKRLVSEADAARVGALKLPGVYTREESKRAYPQGRLAAHVLGFCDIDGRGLAGIEYKMDAILRGRPGMEKVLCDGGRRIIRSPLDQLERAPFNGFDVHLTLDSYIQTVAEQELAKAAAKHQPECATAIVLDARDGSVLAMACWPTFDPQRPADGPPRAKANMAIGGCYEAGSVFKPISVGLALDAGAVTAQTQFDCHQGEFAFGRRVVHDVHPYGLLTVSDIICHSSNIGAAQVSMRLGAEMLYRGVRRFGFGDSTGIALPGEVGGIVRPLRLWSNYSVVSVAFGQEVAVTPLALARAFGAFASGGQLLEPRIIKCVSRPCDNLVAYTAGEPVASGKPISAATADTVLAMMRRVVEEGTGTPAKLEQYAIAGKTGTAQLLRPDGKGYSPNRYLSSFVGIAPVPDSRIIVLVAVKGASRNGYYGGVVAAPVVRDIVLRTLSYMEVPPTQPVTLALGDNT
jgi:cell division protein FtsI (penicillin-binding protein 3)